MVAFTFTPSYPATSPRQPMVNSTKYGDGYEARQQDGLNPLQQVWNLTFLGRTTAEADEIDNFLIARGGVENFDWTPPTGNAVQGRYICRQWSRNLTHGNIENITMTFEQVFDNA